MNFLVLPILNWLYSHSFRIALVSLFLCDIRSQLFNVLILLAFSSYFSNSVFYLLLAALFCFLLFYYFCLFLFLVLLFTYPFNLLLLIFFIRRSISRRIISNPELFFIFSIVYWLIV